MYGDDPLADLIRFLKAWVTNQFARLAPRRYVEVTEQTGRGSSEESVESIACYFIRCFEDYFNHLGVEAIGISPFLAGRRLLEYGPGDLPGVALLMYAYGAAKIYCVDRFPLLKWSSRNVAVIQRILDSLPDHAKARASQAFLISGDPASGLNPDCIEYLVRPNGLCGLRDVVDLVYSRAVLEHVNDLEATFRDMSFALAAGGCSVHKVDLRSHGLHRRNILDFLTWPQPLWRLMYSAKGVPNRWRVNRYRDAIGQTSLVVEKLVASEYASRQVINEVKPRLARPFRGVSDEDLSWLGFWMIAQKCDG